MDARMTTGRKRTWRLGLILALSLGIAPAARADAPFVPPPIGHVWLLNIENLSYASTFGLDKAGTPAPYMAQDLPRAGALLRQYYAIGHNSLDNYLAEISGQAPSPQTQDDCPQYADFSDGGQGAFGQRIGQGCIFPATVKTLADQLGDRGMTWKGYMEDLGIDSGLDGGTSCGHRKPGPQENVQENTPFDQYAAKHNPFVWFRSIIGPGDGQSDLCRERSVSLQPLAGDLERVVTTPNFSVITPNMTSDAHDTPSSEGSIRWTDNWLRQVIPLITSSPAYRQDGMIIITTDEAGLPESTSCCGEIPGPNSPDPGIGGPGGGMVGAVIVSPFVRPGTITDTPYNHYSLLRSLEDAFGITSGGDDGAGHLGFAGSYPGYSGPGAFGPDVYTANRNGQVARARPPGGAPAAADGSTVWQSPSPQGNDLRSVSCSDASHCVAVGDLGAIVATATGTAWTARPSGTGATLNGVSCSTVSRCVAVGSDGSDGSIVRSEDGGDTWARGSSGTTQDLLGVDCPSLALCVAVGNHGTVVRTTDAGATWTAGASGSESLLAAVDCPSVTACFAAGEPATIIGSTNGGATWSAQPAPPPVQHGNGSEAPSRYFAIACTSPAACLAVGDAHWVAVTSDGGTTWRNLDEGYDNSPRALGVSCASASACLVVGTAAAGFPVFGDEVPGSLMPLSIAGVRNGTYIARLSKHLDALNAVSCVSTAACFGVGAHGAIIKFSDVPATASTSSAAVPKWVDQRSAPSRDLGAISCPGRDTCYAVGDGIPVCAFPCDYPDQVIREPSPVLTRSSGGTWTRRFAETDHRLVAVSCSAHTACVTVGDNGTIAATGDGAHWTTIADNDGSRAGVNFLGVSCATDTAACVAVGEHGAAYRSANAGSTWTTGTSGSPVSLNAVSCADALRCVAVGSSGVVLHSGDAGATWTHGASGTAMPLLGVSCATADDCVAVGADATILASADGGATWTPSVSPIDGVDYTAVSCATAAACTATGPDGIVISTGSRGQTWQRQGTGTDRLLRGVSCPAADACYEAGDSGAVLLTAPRTQPAKSTGGSNDGAAATPSTSAGSDPGADTSGSDDAVCTGPSWPATRIASVALARHRLTLTGRSTPRSCAGAAGRVARVDIAVARFAGGRCRGTLLSRRLHPAGTRWALRVATKLARGTYCVSARSVDAAGVAEPTRLRPAIKVRRR
jgi:photosystem II stability/assembly factor-like uncharacterized protein